MDFTVFKNAVAKKFAEMSKGELYRVGTTKNELWDAYLGAFPEGTNNIFRTRAEFDCNCCKQFIRAVGNVVAIVDGQVTSIWDIKTPGEPVFQIVTDALAAFVKSRPVIEQFWHDEKFAGTDHNWDNVDEIDWNHFFVNIPLKFVKHKSLIATAIGETNALIQVFRRSLNELTVDSVETVQELIASNSIYRGAEQKHSVDGFAKQQKLYSALTTDLQKDLFVIQTVVSGRVEVPILRIRNTAIGTLLIDLSEGMELEKAVGRFETTVAGANYKRPTSLVTAKMVEQAKDKIKELGIESALHRRYAALDDISVTNVLFADRSAVAVDSGGILSVFDDIASSTQKPKKFDRAEVISIEDFINNVLPSSKSVEVLLENQHKANMVSLIAPVDPTSRQMFKWDNQFSWSYAGDFADAIKERVKAAGGKVTGDLCCRLSWDNETDLDFHMTEPSGYGISFSNRGRTSPYGGMLDIDANGLSGLRADPVENIVYDSFDKMKTGTYFLKVNPYSIRSRVNEGFTVQVEMNGELYEYYSEKFPTDCLTIAEIVKKADGSVEMKSFLGSPSRASKNIWNLDSQEFQRCNVILNSPNYWDDNAVGNKHYFFMLQDCMNEESARGFYNEFLTGELDKHRKVLEIVGGKMRTQETENQLSGLGFSSTMRNELIVRTTGKTERVFKVQF